MYDIEYRYTIYAVIDQVEFVAFRRGGGAHLLMSKDMAPPLHPGEVLRKDFMEPAGLSATALAKTLGVTPPRINDIVLKRRGVTGDTALRLARYFGGEPLDWLLLQARYDLHVAEVAAGKAIERQIAPRTVPHKQGRSRSDR